MIRKDCEGDGCQLILYGILCGAIIASITIIVCVNINSKRPVIIAKETNE